MRLLHYCVKSVQIRSFFWSVFSHIRTEYGEILRYSVSLRIQADVGKHGPDKTPYLNTFHAVHYFKAVFYCNTERNQWWWIRTTWVLCGKKIKKARWNLFSRDNKVIENIPPTKGALRQHVLKSVLQSSIWRQSLRKDLNGRSTCQWGWQKI